MKLCQAFKLRLRELLEQRNMTIYAFCKNNSIPRTTITNLFKSNSKSPKLSTIYEVAQSLEMSPIKFLDCQYFSPDNIVVD